MPSPHIVKMVDKDWVDETQQSRTDMFLCSYAEAIKESNKIGKGGRTSKNHSIYPITLPPLRLRTPRGGELEIDSEFQKQLRVAKLCHMLGLPEVLTEWRFAKTQVPSRPDFSRSSMPLFRHTGKPAINVKEIEPPANTSKYHTKVRPKFSIIYVSAANWSEILITINLRLRIFKL